MFSENWIKYGGGLGLWQGGKWLHVGLLQRIESENQTALRSVLCLMSGPIYYKVHMK